MRNGHDGVMHHRRELIELAGTAEDVHVRKAREDAGAFALGHAADDADDEIWAKFFDPAKLSKARPDLLLGMLANRARVVHHDVRVVALVDGLVSLCAKLPQNQLAVEHVHLAAKGFEVQLLVHPPRSI